VIAGGWGAEEERTLGEDIGEREGDEGEKGGAVSFRRGVRNGGGGGRGISRCGHGLKFQTYFPVQSRIITRVNASILKSKTANK
jgi:hypothetical protein